MLSGAEHEKKFNNLGAWFIKEEVRSKDADTGGTPPLTSHCSGTLHIILVHVTLFWYTSHCFGTRHIVLVHFTLFWYTSHCFGTRHIILVHVTLFWYTSHCFGTRHIVLLRCKIVPKKRERS